MTRRPLLDITSSRKTHLQLGEQKVMIREDSQFFVVKILSFEKVVAEIAID
jgi:hypothetical protein